MFTYEKEISKKDNHEYIVITGFEGSAKELTIPDSIDGLPVEVIGSHAFAARQDIEKVSLPSTVTTLRSYAFHNSRSLKKISLYDSIDDYYDGVCRQCDSLRDIEITIERGWFEVIRNFLADSDRQLRFMVHVKGEINQDSCLTFPGYVYDFNENTMARTIQFSIAGSGMFYRECVDRRKIEYRQYDNLFEKAMIDGGEVSQDIALGRLLFPVELEDRHRAMYENYIRENGCQLLKRLIDEAISDIEGISLLESILSYAPGTSDGAQELFYDKDMESAISYAVSRDNPRITSIIMDKSRGGKAAAAGDMFIL